MIRQRQRFVAFIIALELISSACGSSPSAPTATSPSVVGRVFDYQTNGAVSGATVAFGNYDLSGRVSITAQSTTSQDGSYQIPSLSATRYLVSIDNASGGLALVRSGPNRIDLFVHPHGCIGVYGSIADGSTGLPLAGAAVSLVSVNTNSGSDGTYRLDLGCRAGLWSNSICLKVTRTGYQDACQTMGRGENLIGVILQDVDLAPQ
jgi:hypothetical protein